MKLPKTEVIEKLRLSLRLLGRDHNTVSSYCRTAAHYYDFVARQPRGRSSEDLAEAFLSLRVTRDDVSASTQNHDLAALNALYAAFGCKLGNVDALRAKRPQYARHCPTTPELMSLLGALVDTPELPARLMALTMAATGLRISECLCARLKDFRSEGDKLHLVVRDPKQAHDRWVLDPRRVEGATGRARVDGGLTVDVAPGVVADAARALRALTYPPLTRKLYSPRFTLWAAARGSVWQGGAL